jgi:hypothetical protein
MDTQLVSQIQCLTDLYNSLQSLRQIPSLVLRPPISHSLSSPPTPARQEFKELRDFGETLCSDAVQDALRAARQSEIADKREIVLNGRRENRKRR